jgi:peroxiredoxin Q/BCP
MKMPEVGDKAPEINGIDQDGQAWKLSDQKGKKVILYFYPKDDTPGCTKEACSFRDNYKQLLKDGYVVIGVSPDKAPKHKKFIDKYDLPFPLLEDPEKQIIESYGVWGPKKFMGREFDGVLRTTFVIDEKGKVAERIDKVKTKDAAQQVMDLMA